MVTFGAFFWQLRPFLWRAGIWVTATTSIILVSIWLNEIHVEEVVEIPMLTLILALVSAIATRRARAEEKLKEANEQLESRVLERTHKLQKANTHLQREIDERRRVEATLRQSEERYRQLMELSFETIMIHQNGKLVEINSAGARLLGAQTTGELLTQPLRNFVYPTRRSVVEKRLQQVSQSQTGIPPLEEKFVRIDGTTDDVEVVAIPIDYNGQRAIQMLARDITRRREAEIVRNLEPMRIGRDLHDSLGQSIGYLHLKLDEFVGSQAAWITPDQRRELAKMRDVANEAYEQIR